MIREYGICARCIMDTTASDIRFNENGVCNYCTEYLTLIKELHINEAKKEELLKNILNEIKENGKDKEYDCILGISGGLDSSYLIYNAKKIGLRPLAVHVDNGWNTELAVSNIEKLVKSLDIDLYTNVINWEEFRDLQMAFFMANVIDIEMLTDHAILATLYNIAFERKINYILAGTNIANEGMRMPPNWNHVKIDLKNIKSIYRKFGSGKRLESFPMMGLTKFIKYKYIERIKWVEILDYLHYDKQNSIQILSKELGWKPYEKKHYESVFTRFYQAYILPKKFNIDKRRLHYSTLICSGQMSREEVLELMKKTSYDDLSSLEEDKEFVLKKLGFTHEEFEDYLNSPPVPHNFYPSTAWYYYKLKGINKLYSACKSKCSSYRK